jgi:Nodulation protein S (NodS)
VTLPTEYFDRLYDAQPDPWGFTGRWYEERKRAVTLAALPDRRYGSAFEPGCSLGVLTQGLASRCDQVLAIDVSDAAVEQARTRLAGASHVRVERGGIPRDWPEAQFDLVVLSEILYYLDDGDLARTVDRSVGAVSPRGVLISVHWRYPVSDYPQSGDGVQAAVERAAVPHLVRLVRHLEDDFDLAVYVRPIEEDDNRRLSVGARAGLC